MTQAFIFRSSIPADELAPTAVALRRSSRSAKAQRGSIVFTSHVAEIYRGALEMLVYFNAGQSRVADGIVDAVERFGPLEIVSEKDRLRVSVSGLADAQSLFAVEASTGRPLGVAVYARPDFQHMIVVHLGIAAEFASGGIRANEQLLLRLLRELRRSSRRIKGVERFELLYLSGRGRNLNRNVPRHRDSVDLY
jgi:hypothetical protein